MAQTYDEQTKAAALAELATGASVSSVSRKYGVARRTLQSWRDRFSPTVPHQKRDWDVIQEEIENELLGFIRDGIKFQRAVLEHASDPDYIKKQPAGELATLLGVTNDKVVRLVGALRRPNPTATQALGTGESD